MEWRDSGGISRRRTVVQGRLIGPISHPGRVWQQLLLLLLLPHPTLNLWALRQCGHVQGRIVCGHQGQLLLVQPLFLLLHEQNILFQLQSCPKLMTPPFIVLLQQELQSKVTETIQFRNGTVSFTFKHSRRQ
jgi:hypothetical protein